MKFWLKKIWDNITTPTNINEIPNCHACKGTGEPTGQWANWGVVVIWKGQFHTVCHNCEGTGKS